MARVPYLDTDDVAPEHRDLLETGLNLYRALGHAPDSARQFRELGMQIRYHMKLDPRLRELAILQVGYLSRAPYEYTHHIEIGRRVGVSDEDLRAIALESSGAVSALPVLDRMVLQAARELVAGPAMSADCYSELETLLGRECLVELVLTISFYCGVVRVLGALEIDVEPAYQDLLREFPFAPE